MAGHTEILVKAERLVEKADEIRRRWFNYSNSDFARKAPEEYASYQEELESTLDELLRSTGLVPKRSERLKVDEAFLIEKLTQLLIRGLIGKSQPTEYVTYLYTELVAARKVMEWAFSENSTYFDWWRLRHNIAREVIDDIALYSYRLVKVVAQHLGVKWFYMRGRPSLLWSSECREALEDLTGRGRFYNWRTIAPLIRLVLEIDFLDPFLHNPHYRFNITQKHVRWESLHGRLKGASFGTTFAQIDNLLHIYRWASAYVHWGVRYTVGSCWLIAGYLLRLRVDEVLRGWIRDNPDEFLMVLQNLEKDGFIANIKRRKSDDSP